MSILRKWWRATTFATLAFLAASSAVHAQAAADGSGPLVTTDWLDKNLSTPKLRIIEVSVNPGLYERGHVPGAVNFSWHSDLNDRVRRDIVSQADFEKLLSSAGVDNDTTVVLYGDNNNWFAAWGAWVFEQYGVRNVKLLDGGRKKWEAEGRVLENRTPEIVATRFKVTQPNPQLRARLVDVVSVAEGKSDTRLVDIRSADEFSGKIFAPPGAAELTVRAGHIPTAANVSWGRAVNEDGTFKSAAELKTIYSAAGLDGSKPIITYCRIGERSSHTWFALTRILGYKNVRNYEGSWTEYGNAVGLPVSNPSGTIWASR